MGNKLSGTTGRKLVYSIYGKDWPTKEGQIVSYWIAKHYKQPLLTDIIDIIIKYFDIILTFDRTRHGKPIKFISYNRILLNHKLLEAARIYYAA